MKKHAIVVIDDHPLILEGIVRVIEKLPAFSVVGQGENGIEGIEVVKQQQVDVLIADIDMPKLNGIEMVKAIKDIDSSVKIVFLTSHVNLNTFQQATQLDYWGFVFKENAIDELEACLNAVVNEEVYLSSDFEAFVEVNKEELSKLDTLKNVMELLTKSELNVLKLIAQGLTTSQIAEKLFNSVKTIENHRYNICKKIGLDGNNTLMRFAIENRLFFQES